MVAPGDSLFASWVTSGWRGSHVRRSKVLSLDGMVLQTEDIAQAPRTARASILNRRTDGMEGSESIKPAIVERTKQGRSVSQKIHYGLVRMEGEGEGEDRGAKGVEHGLDKENNQKKRGGMGFLF